MRRNHRGVTLFEMILVFTILAIGAGAAFPKMAAMQRNKMIREAGETLEVLADAGRRYAFETGISDAEMMALTWDQYKTALLDRGLIDDTLINSSKYCFGKSTTSTIYVYVYLKRNGVCSTSLDDFTGFYAPAMGRASDMKYIPGKNWTYRQTSENDF